MSTPRADPPWVFAIVGAESTGKSTLAEALAARLTDATGWRCTWVPEYLREWCERADFREALPGLLGGEDLDFQEYIRKIAGKESNRPVAG